MNDFSIWDLLLAVGAGLVGYTLRRSPKPQPIPMLDLALIDQLSPEARLVVHDNGIILQSNPYAEDLFRYFSSEVVNTPLQRLLPAVGSIPALEALCRQHQMTLGTGIEESAIKKHGVSFPVELHVHHIPQSPLYLITVKNLESHRRGAETEGELQLLSSVLQSVETPIFVVNWLGEIVRHNRAFARFVSKEDTEIQTRRYWELLLPKEDWNGEDKRTSDLILNMATEQRECTWLIGGSSRLVHISFSGLLVEGCIPSYAVCFAQESLPPGEFQTASSRSCPVDENGVDINDVVRRNQPILRELFGRSCRLSANLDLSLSMVSADRASLERMLLSIALAARSSMAGQGRITVETASVELPQATDRGLDLPMGHYVTLAVLCQDQDHLNQRAADSFFETNLSSVSAIAAHYGGRVVARTLPLRGREFRVYLPSHEKKLDTVTNSLGVACLPHLTEGKYPNKG